MNIGTKTCDSCQSSLPDHARFCGKCGAAQDRSHVADASGRGGPRADADPSIGATSAGQVPRTNQPPPPLGSSQSHGTQPEALEPPVGPTGRSPHGERFGGQIGRLRSASPRAVVAAALGLIGLCAVGGAAVWFLVGRGGSASDAILVVESDDLYVVDEVAQVADPPRADRLLRDVAVAGTTFVADGEDVIVYGTFDYDHEGSPLFSYSEDGDDEWTLAVLDDREIVDIAQFENIPFATYVTTSGTYVIEQRSSSCSILRVEGRDTSRVSRADQCLVNPEADIGVLVERRQSQVEISFVDLRSGEESTVFDIDEGSAVAIAFSPTNRSMMVSGSNFDDSAAVLVDLRSGAIIAEDRVSGDATIDSGFVGYEFSSDESTLVFVSAAGTQELASGPSLHAAFSRDGSSILVREFEDDGETVLSVAEVEGDTIGPLTEIEVFSDAVAVEFLDDERALLVDGDGLVAVLEGDELVEIGDLRPESEFSSPQIESFGEAAMVVATDRSVGLVRASDAAFLELTDLEGLAFGALSPDGDWLAVSGYESQERAEQTLVLIDLRSLDWAIVDEEPGFGGLQFSDDHLYFQTLEADGELRRVGLGLDERVEDIAEDGVSVFVPGEGTRLTARSWDVPFLTLE